jgi:hypothetical protein
MAQDDEFDVGKIYYNGHWKGWALKIDTFLGPEMTTSKAKPFGLKKIRDF